MDCPQCGKFALDRNGRCPDCGPFAVPVLKISAIAWGVFFGNLLFGALGLMIYFVYAAVQISHAAAK